jgi:hypothetical protein
MKTSRVKFPRRVRIHGGECGAVARALHHEAEKFSLPAGEKKVFSTTLERKVMSKKTFFKRIALTAIAALGFGMISVAPSQALITATAISFDADDSLTLTGGASDSATATLTFTQTALSASDSQTVKVSITSSNGANVTNLYMRVSDSSTSSTVDAGAAATSPFISFGAASSGTSTAPAALVSRVGYDASADYSTANYDSATVSPRSNSINTSTVKFTVGLYKIAKAGTYTVKAIVIDSPQNGSGGTLNSKEAVWTVTVTGADTIATGASTAIMAAGATEPGVADSAVAAVRTATTQAATIKVTQRNATSTAAESMTVTVSGEAYVTSGTAAAGTAPDTTTPGVKTATVKAGNYIQIWPTGTAGTATISITTFSGLSLGSKTITTYGTRSAIAVDKANLTIGRAGSGSVGYTTGTSSPTATTPAAFTIKVTDSGGRGVGGVSVTGVSSNSNVIASVSCAADDSLSDYSTGGVGFYNCSYTTAAGATSGQSATITFRMTDPAVTTSTAYITATAQTVTIGGKIATETVKFDKTEYNPGEAMQITYEAKDASGNPVYDGAAYVALTCNSTISGSVADSEWGFYVGGKAVAGNNSYERLFAPATAGNFICTGLGGEAGLVKVEGSAKVKDTTGVLAAAEAANDAAAEAIDAANAATDAANLAAEAADAATVAAEEARDAADAATAAVEELATQVATLMAALKAQITTLANTVAKIAKKVKA